MLAIGALAAAAVAYLSTQRARRAERQAEETRVEANQARGHAEQLLGYLTDDFARELGSFGRVDLVGELAKRQLDYFKALPEGLKDRETTRNGALAMVQYARAMRTLGQIPAARSTSDEGVRLLQRLRQEGDTSERTTIALAMGTEVQELVLDNEQSPQSLPTAQRALDIIKPLATAPHASIAARRAYIETLGRFGFEQLRAFKTEDALATLQIQMREAAALGARDLTHVDIAAQYAESGGWQVEALATLGRGEQARKVGADAGAVAAKVLDLRPGYLQALRAQNLISSSLGGLAMDDMRDADAIILVNRGEAASRALARLDPGNTIVSTNLAVDLQIHGSALWQTGRPHEAVKYFLEAAEVNSKGEHAGASFALNDLQQRALLAVRQADLGDAAGLRATQARSAQKLAALRRSERAGTAVILSADCMSNYSVAGAALFNDDLATTRRLGRECISHLTSLVPQGETQKFMRSAGIFYVADLVGQAEYKLGNYAAAERVLREALDARSHWPTNSASDRREEAEVSTLLALALARQGHLVESEKVIGPVVKLHRQLAARNHDDQWQHVELAAALFAQALTDKPHRASLLKESAALVNRVPAEMGQLHSVRLWRDRLRQEQHARAVAMASEAAERGVE